MSSSTQDRKSSKPDGYFEPVYKPLTRRNLMFGVPYFTLILEGFLGLQFMNFGLTNFLVLLPISHLILVWAYRKDEWAVGAWIQHIRRVVQGTTRIEL